MIEPKNPNRRDLLSGLLAAVVPGARQDAESAAPVQAEADEAGESASVPEPERRWGMVIDLDLCSGCGACLVACKSENNVPMQGPEPEHEGCGIEWMSLLPKTDELHRGEGIPMEVVPTPCFHCDNPPCVKVCPVNATYQNDEGLVAQIWDRCIGCRYCTVACPYSRRSFNWKHAEWPDTYLNMLNPDVAPRPEGIVEKCTFCYHRIRKVKETARVEGRPVEGSELDRLTACSQSCPAGAIVFGDLNDPEGRATELATSPRASREQVHIGTEPKVYYLARNRRDL